MVIGHDNYKWSPGQQLCARMTKVDNYVPEWVKLGSFCHSLLSLVLAAAADACGVLCACACML
jgi:hypothetical protein